MIHVGFTGTRKGMTIAQHASVVKIMLQHYARKKHYGEDYAWHHGICIGADQQVHILAKIFEFDVHGHPPEDRRYMAPCSHFNHVYSPQPYITRNHHIVNTCYLLVATPKEVEEIQRSGTWATVRYARNQGKDVIVINPLGECTA